MRVRERGEVATSGGEREQRALHPRDARELLGTEPDFAREAAREVLARDAEREREIGDARARIAREETDRATHERIGRVGVGQSRARERREHAHARGPGWCARQTIDERAHVEPERLRRHALIDELGERSSGEARRRPRSEADRHEVARPRGHEHGAPHRPDELRLARVQIDQEIDATVGEHAMAALAALGSARPEAIDLGGERALGHDLEIGTRAHRHLAIVPQRRAADHRVSEARTAYPRAMRALRIACLASLLAACNPTAGGASDAGSADAPATDAASPTADAAGPAADTGTPAITADAIRAALGATCTPVTGSGLYAPDEGEAETLPICQGPGSILYWVSDLDVDCDGGRTATCMRDPAYMAETSIDGSDGLPIDAETVPFVVIPLPSARFTYGDHEIALGQLALVTYGDQWAIGVFADEGPDGILGEASYAMAQLLGVDPDPITGGADSGATFVIFTGASARIDHVEDHDAAVAAAMPLVEALLAR